MPDTSQTWRTRATVLILLVYAVSFGLPLFINHVPPPGRSGGLVFQPAGTYITPGYAGFALCFMAGYMTSAAWLANPLLFFGLYSLLRGRNVRALAAGLMAMGFGLLALPPCLEANRRDPQYIPQSAYWTWLASMFLLAIAGGVFRFQQEKPRLH
jgi:hypothetical protein